MPVNHEKLFATEAQRHGDSFHELQNNAGLIDFTNHKISKNSVIFSESLCLRGITAVLLLIFIALTIAPAGAVASESVRTQEINQCLSGELVTWGDGRDRPAIASQLKFAYHHAAAPDWFSEPQVAAMVAKAAEEWSQCGIRTSIVGWGVLNLLKPDVIRVQWSDKESRGNFGLANLGKRTLSLGPKAFALLKTRNPAYDSRQTLQMVISHEMGHFFGLMAHSRRCVDVLSYYDNGKGEACYSRDPAQMRTVKEYRSIFPFPTACDIERCRNINGMTPLLDGRLAEHPRTQ